MYVLTFVCMQVCLYVHVHANLLVYVTVNMYEHTYVHISGDVSNRDLVYVYMYLIPYMQLL